MVGGPDVGPGGLEQLVLGALGHDAALADHDQVVGDDLDLVEEVAGEQHGAALVGVPAEQVAHPADAGRVEAVGGLVEDQHLRVADEGGRDAEALAHAEGVVADPAARLLVGEADDGEHLVDPALRHPHRALGQGEDLAAGAAGVLRGGVQQHADLTPRVGQLGEVAAEDGGLAGGRGGEPDHDAHGRGLAGAVGAQEAGDPAGLGGERHVVDGPEAAVRLGQVGDGDHGLKPGSADALPASGTGPGARPDPDPERSSGSDPESPTPPAYSSGLRSRRPGPRSRRTRRCGRRGSRGTPGRRPSPGSRPRGRRTRSG